MTDLTSTILDLARLLADEHDRAEEEKQLRISTAQDLVASAKECDRLLAMHNRASDRAAEAEALLAREHQRADDATARAEQAERDRDDLRAKIEAADERKAAELTEDNADLVRLRSERGAIVDSRAALRISVDNLTTDRDRWKAKAEAAERRLAEVSGPGVKVGAVTWTDDINNSGATMGRLRLNAIDGPRCRWDVYSDGDAIIDGAPAADIASAKAAAVAFALSLNGATLTPGPVVLPAPASTASDEEIARDLYAATAVPGAYDDLPWESAHSARKSWTAAVASVRAKLTPRGSAQTCPQCGAPEIHCAGCGTATTRAWTCYDCAAGDRGEPDPERARITDRVLNAARESKDRAVNAAIVALDSHLNHLAGKAPVPCLSVNEANDHLCALPAGHAGQHDGCIGGPRWSGKAPAPTPTSDRREALLAGGVLPADADRILGDQAPAPTVEPFDFAAFLDARHEWAVATFGPGTRTAGILDHIRKELAEIEAKPGDASEWVDLIFLATDGAIRAAVGSGAALVDALLAKDAKNRARTWPDWRTAPPDKAIEHDRSKDAPPVEPAPTDAQLDRIFAAVDGFKLGVEHAHDTDPHPLVPLTAERLAGAVERAIGAKDAMGKAYARGHADDILRHLDPVGVAPDQAEVIVLGYMREHLALLDHQRGTGDYSIAPGLPLQREAMRRALASIGGGR